MTLLKVGDQLAVSGYKSITLCEDMQSNISKFANINGIENAEAERILSNVPALQDFIESLNLQDEEEDIVITDFNLDDDVFNEKTLAATDDVKSTPNTSEANEITEASSVGEVSEVAASSSTSEVGNGIVFATKSQTTNDNTVKDLLGIFGFSATQSIDEKIYTGTKVTGFIINGTRYEAEVLTKDDPDTKLLNEVGVIKTTITKANGEVTTGQYPEADPIYAKIAAETEKIIALIDPLIDSASKIYRKQEYEKLKETICTRLKNYSSGCSKETIMREIQVCIAEAGFDTTNYAKAISTPSIQGLEIIKSCQSFGELSSERIAKEKEEEKYTNKTVKVNGVIFKIRYLTSGSNNCKISASGSGTIIVEGKNCEVNLMGFGEKDQNIQINGSNIKFNCNAVSVSTIKNSASSSKITGSFGNDNITNTTSGSSTTINGGDGDDVVWNYAKNAKLNGDTGNDTIINYGNGTTINGGDDDDSINYVNGTAKIIESEGNDTYHIIDSRIESDDPTYPFAKKYTIDGLTFIAYSETDDFSGLSVSKYKNLITINTSNMKIKVTAGTDKLAVNLTGANIKFYTNAQLKSVFNNAENSELHGSEKDDFLYNYTEGSTLDGGKGNDALINEGEKADIDGGNGTDKIYNRETGKDSTIHTDSKDKVYDDTKNTTSKLTKGTMSTSEYNMAVNMAYIKSALTGQNVPSTPDATTSTRNKAQNLASKLVTTESGKKVYSELAKKLIQYAQKLTAGIGITNNSELLKIALNNIDTNKDGDITDTELQSFDDKLAQEQEDEEITKALSNLSNELQASLGVTASEISNFISSYTNESDALNALKQIKAILNVATNSSTNLSYSLSNIQDIITSSNTNFNNEILADAQILVEASTKDDPDAYIKSQMIKDGSGQTLTQLASSTSVGDVVEKDGKLYVNDSGKMVALGISADTYLELFPPVERFFVEQNSYNDCFFIATTLMESMEKPAARAKILQMFSENSNGDITVTFPGISDYPVTFQNGKLKETDNEWNQGGTIYEYKSTQTATTACLGESMLEQAYALAKFTQISNSTLSNDSIASTYSQEMANAIKANGKVTNASTLDIDEALLFYIDGGYATEVLDDLYGTTSNGSDKYNKFSGKSESTLTQLMSTLYANSYNGNTILTTLISGGTEISAEDKSKYNIISGHQYAIESINTKSKTVSLKNPWDPYKTIDIPYSVFFKYFYGVLNRTIN